MDVKKLQVNANGFLDVIKTIENSIIKEFIDLNPKNDYEYLKLWFMYLKFKHDKGDTIYYYLESYYNSSEIEDYIRHHNLKNQVDSLLSGQLDKKKKKLSFLPKLEQYVNEFDTHEQHNIRLLILAILKEILDDNISIMSLLAIANKYKIPESFLFSLNSKHRLFEDKMISIEEDSYRGKSLFTKYVTTNPLLFSIFADLPVNEIDKANLLDNGIARFFNVISAEEYQTHLAESPGEDYSDDFDSDEDLDQEFDPDNIDDLLSEIENYDNGPDELDLIEKEIEEKTDKDEEESFQPYKTDIEYFLDDFEYYNLLIKAEENKEYTRYGEEDEAKQLPFKIKNQKNKCEIRLKKSIKAGFTPRIEKLSRDMRLTGFEKNVLKFLTSMGLFGMDDHYSVIKIRGLIKLLEPNPLKQMEMRKYFRKSAKLIKSGLVHMEEKWDINETIFDCEIRVDSRLIELLSGQSFDISEFIDGTFLYHSGIKMKNVILPEEDKQKVLELIKNFDKIQKARKNIEFDKHFEYGNALVMLFTGPSGTGKTMLANAISNFLKKKILLFNLNNMTQLSSISKETGVFQTIFREARLNDAVLFFDESEALLSDRLNDLLIEIERHDGIVIFATNASFKIDSAMRRRILHFVHFKDPGANLRKQIWNVHLFDFPKKLQLSDDVNLDQLASKYEISGGLIKNAIFTALVKAVNNDKSDHPVIQMKHLMEGAKEQLDNKFFMSKMENVRIPQKGLESIVIPEKTRETILEIINFEKARKVLEGQWGFSEVFPDKNGITALFHGPPGTGKTLTAEAIAYETGKTLKQVNYAQIVSKYVGETEKALEALFTEITDNKSILLFDEADALFAKRTEVSSANARFLNMETDLLLSLIERNNVFAILTTNNINNVDEAFFRRMTYLLKFEKPDANLRKELWKTLIPVKLPVGDVDYEYLANKFELTGAEIKNVIIRTATKKALILDDGLVIETKDFEEVCKYYLEADTNQRKAIGFGK